ncbi:MAG: hypothetical protein CYG60_09785 [Actinobacteria bacterium]|nr:MAG: hypothetical protein CYG60_09785 [Actinomycetota bacterium]
MMLGSSFSTVLKGVTGYFDRRALISTFFPTLVFWALVLLVLELWDNIGSGLAQTPLTLVAFFVGVVVFSFFMTNFQPALTRMYEGNWPDVPPFSWLYGAYRRNWQRRWLTLESQRDSLGRAEAESRGLLDLLAPLSDQVCQKVTIDEQQGRELDKLLEELGPTLEEIEVDLKVPNASLSAYFRVYSGRALERQFETKYARLAESLSETKAKLQRWVNDCKHKPKLAENEKTGWSQRRCDQLSTCVSRLKVMPNEIEEKRLRKERNFYLYLPPAPDDVMPTRFGNVGRG